MFIRQVFCAIISLILFLCSCSSEKTGSETTHLGDCNLISPVGEISGDQIKVLIIDGVNNHDWEMTTDATKATLEQTGRFKVDLSTSPRKRASKEEWNAYRPKFSDYQVVIGNFNDDCEEEDGCDPLWSPKTMADFERFVSEGGGFYDPDGTIASHAWDFGDEATATGAIVTHAYAVAGTYTVNLTVTDDDGVTGTDTAEVTVLSPAQAIVGLIGIVEDMNLQQGIENSLDVKLEAVHDALVAANAGVREDAVNKLVAFANAVEAQRGKVLTDAQADELVIYAGWIIAALSG